MSKHKLNITEYRYFMARSLFKYLNVHAYYHIAHKLGGLYHALTYTSIQFMNANEIGLTIHPAFFKENSISVNKEINVLSAQILKSPKPKHTAIVINCDAFIKAFDSRNKPDISFYKSDTEFAFGEMSIYYINRITNAIKTSIITNYQNIISIDAVNHLYNPIEDDYIQSVIGDAEVLFNNLVRYKMFNRMKRVELVSLEEKISKEEDTVKGNHLVYKSLMFDMFSTELLSVFIPTFNNEYGIGQEYRQTTVTENTLLYNPLLYDNLQSLYSEENGMMLASYRTHQIVKDRSNEKVCDLNFFNIRPANDNSALARQFNPNVPETWKSVMINLIELMCHEYRHVLQNLKPDLKYYDYRNIKTSGNPQFHIKDRIREIIQMNYKSESKEIQRDEIDAMIYSYKTLGKMMNDISDTSSNTIYRAIFDGRFPPRLEFFILIAEKWSIMNQTGLNETWTDMFYKLQCDYNMTEIKSKLKNIDMKYIKRNPYEYTAEMQKKEA